MPRAGAREGRRCGVAAVQSGDHGAHVAGEKRDAGTGCERPGDVVQADTELPRQAVRHRTGLDDRVQARDRCVAFRSVDGAPEGRGLVGPAFRPGRLPAEAGGARDDERYACHG